MNLLYYQVKFPAHRHAHRDGQYSQYAYADTRGSGSYQLAYVLHPATLWKEFGPIHVQVELPKGVPCRASTPMVATKGCRGETSRSSSEAGIAAHQVYESTLTKPQEKSGELFVGADKTEWEEDHRNGLPKPSANSMPGRNYGRSRQRAVPKASR